MKNLLITIIMLFCLCLNSQNYNEPDSLLNVALYDDAKIFSSLKNGRGIPTDILYNPKEKDYVTRSIYGEYGVNYGDKLEIGKPFIWQVMWDDTKLINYITFAGTYPNQPQSKTSWIISYLYNDEWNLIEKGRGGWIDSGIYKYKTQDLQPIKVDALRLEIFSDEKNTVSNIHLRGRGGITSAFGDKDVKTKPKATLIQLLPYIDNEVVVVPNEPIDSGIKLVSYIDSLKNELVKIKVTSEINKRKIEVLKNRNNYKKLSANLYIGSGCDEEYEDSKLLNPIDLNGFKIIINNGRLTLPGKILVEGKMLDSIQALAEGLVVLNCKDDELVILL